MLSNCRASGKNNSKQEPAFMGASVTMGTSKSHQPNLKRVETLITPPPPSIPTPLCTPAPLMHRVHKPRSTIKLRVRACLQGAALAGDWDGLVHGHVLPPSPSQRHEGLSAAAGTVKPTGCSLGRSLQIKADLNTSHAGKMTSRSGAWAEKCVRCFLPQDRQAQSAVSATPHGWH